MPRKKKTIFYIYRTTCVINKKYYIGMHSTNNIDDGYLGSGKRLRRSIRKYGERNHIKEILEFTSDWESLVTRESEIITEILISDNMCMNLMTGGKGGFISDEQQRHRSLCGAKAFKKRFDNDAKLRKLYSEIGTKNFKEAHEEGKIRYDTFKGLKHTEETKRKIGEKNSVHQQGKENSQYGTMWITNGIENKKIKKEDNIPNNWYKGRKLK